jgi:hypothetical protein
MPLDRRQDEGSDSRKRVLRACPGRSAMTLALVLGVTSHNRESVIRSGRKLLGAFEIANQIARARLYTKCD